MHRGPPAAQVMRRRSRPPSVMRLRARVTWNRPAPRSTEPVLTGAAVGLVPAGADGASTTWICVGAGDVVAKSVRTGSVGTGSAGCAGRTASVGMIGAVGGWTLWLGRNDGK